MDVAYLRLSRLTGVDIAQLAHAADDFILSWGSDALFPNDFGEDLLEMVDTEYLPDK